MTGNWQERRERLPNGIELALCERGLRNGKPSIVALHGWLDNSASLVPLAEAMPSWHWNLVDLSGHGLSSHRSIDSAYHFVEWLHDIDLLVRRISEAHGPVIILGHSLGAALATILTAAIPERVKALVSIDGLGGLADEEGRRLQHLRQHLEDRYAALTRSRIADYESLDYMVALRQRAAPLPESIAKTVVQRNAIELESGRWTWRSDPRLRMASAFRLGEDFYQELMNQIDLPVLAFFAHQNGVLNFPAQAKRLLGTPLGKAVFVEGSHHFHATDPAFTAAEVEKFLSSALAR